MDKIRTCPQCKKEFAVPKVSSPKKYCCRTCYDDAKRIGRAIPCENCGKLSYKNPLRIKKDAHHYCSRDCRALGRRKYGQTRFCQQCKKAFSITFNNPDQVFCSQECGYKSQRRRVTYTCVSCQKEFTIKRRKIDPKYCSQECHIRASASKKAELPTDIEREMGRLLTQMRVAFWEQYPVKWYTIDFYLPKYEIAIECDGDYWHSMPKALIRDRQKSTYLTNKGMLVLRFSGQKIKTELEWCKKQIRQAIKMQRNLAPLMPPALAP